jgi:hypothetical protein
LRNASGDQTAFASPKARISLSVSRAARFSAGSFPARSQRSRRMWPFFAASRSTIASVSSSDPSEATTILSCSVG